MHGKKGSACAYPHPPMCFKYIKRGPKGCAKGTSCKFAHPKLCRASLVSGKCNRKRCYFYHVTNSKTTENSRSSHERVSNSNRATPLMNLNIPPYNPHQANSASLNPTHIQHQTQSQYMPSYMAHPYQTTTPHIRPERPLPQQKDNAETPTQPPVFLEQMKVLKQLMTDMQHAQNQLLLTMSQAWPLLAQQ